MLKNQTQHKIRLAFIADALDNQTAGVHHYTKEVAKQLIALSKDPANNLEIYFIHLKANPLLGDLKRDKDIVVPDRQKIPGYRTWRYFFKIPQVCKKLKIDVVWQPAQFGPFNLPKSIKRVTTIHDLTAINLSRFHKFRDSIWQKLFLKFQLTRTDLIVTPSQATTDELIGFVPSLSSEKVLTNHLASRFSAFEKEFPSSTTESTKGLPIQPYILVVGTKEPRKNHKTVVKAYKILKEIDQKYANWELVFVGPNGWLYDNDINLSGVINKGYVPDFELIKLYQNAQVLVYPSFYEGFGLPVIEAMSLGCPVITTKKGALAEVGQNAVFYIENPLDPTLIVKAIQQLDSQPSLKQKFIEAGKELSAKSSWLKHVEQVLAKIFT